MSHRLTLALLLGVVAIGPAACNRTVDGSSSSSIKAIPGTALGVRKEWMDTAVKPGDDWYRYANGHWNEATPIPADRSGIGAFWIASENTDKQLATLIDEIEKSSPKAGTDVGKVKAYYDAYMNTQAIDAAGMTPVQPAIARFEAIGDKTELAKELGSQIRADVDPLNATNFHTPNLFGIFVSQPLKGGNVAPYILQGGLGLPDREYYLSSDPKMAKLRKDYRSYVENLLAAAGISNPAARAQRIFDLETHIAQAHASREASNDWSKAAQMWMPEDFSKKAPGLDWPVFFAAAQLGQVKAFDAYHPTAIPKLAALVASQPLEAWKDWLIFHQIDSNTDVLPQKLDQLHFAFFGKELTGAEQQRPRAKRALAALNQDMGDALGKLYTQKYFPASAKAEIQEMVANIKAAFAKRIENIDWMAPATKKEAKAKVEGMSVGVGYPDKWTDYTALQVSPNNAYANRQAAEMLRYRQQLAKIGKPQDKGEWWMNAQLVNAVNLPVQNALNFPAAILQPPFFDPKADPAYNYGAIGAVIGHEISHSFDNNGAAFDASGTMRNWWTPADKKHFEKAGKALARQFDQYEPFPGMHVNGELTLGEDIADIAGLNAAYEAYHASLGGKPAPVIAGFTGDQRFFLAFGQTWATKMRDAALRKQILTNEHAPGQYRALTVRNMDAWYKAFTVQPGEKLYLAPDKRVKIY